MLKKHLLFFVSVLSLCTINIANALTCPDENLLKNKVIENRSTFFSNGSISYEGVEYKFSTTMLSEPSLCPIVSVKFLSASISPTSLNCVYELNQLNVSSGSVWVSNLGNHYKPTGLNWRRDRHHVCEGDVKNCTFEVAQ